MTGLALVLAEGNSLASPREPPLSCGILECSIPDAARPHKEGLLPKAARRADARHIHQPLLRKWRRRCPPVWRSVRGTAPTIRLLHPPRACLAASHRQGCSRRSDTGCLLWICKQSCMSWRLHPALHVHPQVTHSLFDKHILSLGVCLCRQCCRDRPQSYRDAAGGVWGGLQGGGRALAGGAAERGQHPLHHAAVGQGRLIPWPSICQRRCWLLRLSRGTTAAGSSMWPKTKVLLIANGNQCITQQLSKGG